MQVILVLVACTALKVLLFPSYRSTDFEVHRNWLAITYTHPHNIWYSDNSSDSQWTLDYPPFFAWFEYGLSQIAQYIDKDILDVANLNYASPRTVLFQRCTVLIGEMVCLTSVMASLNPPWLLLIAGHPGLLFTDHIHFQYNGMLIGIFLWSIQCATSKPIWGAILFTVLLNLKHLFLYAAPAFFVYLLRWYCLAEKSNILSIRRFLTLAGCCVFVSALSLGPFALDGVLSQLAKRLFPVGRGLLHAYWAPNFWALYATADRALILVAKKLFKFQLTDEAKSSTVGLIGDDVSFYILPRIGAMHTALITVLMMVPVLVSLWRKRPYRRSDTSPFSMAVILCTLTAFLFGYHVHEKAVLMVILPMLAFPRSEPSHTWTFLLNVIGTYSLFPLLPHSEEYPLKVLLLLLFVIASYTLLKPLLSRKHRLYLYGLAGVEMYGSVLHPLLQYYYSGSGTTTREDTLFPFLPLLLISAYCGLGLSWGWAALMREYIQSRYK